MNKSKNIYVILYFCLINSITYPGVSLIEYKRKKEKIEENLKYFFILKYDRYMILKKNVIIGSVVSARVHL